MEYECRLVGTIQIVWKLTNDASVVGDSIYIGKVSHVTPNIDSLDGTELLSRQVMETNYD